MGYTPLADDALPALQRRLASRRRSSLPVLAGGRAAARQRARPMATFILTPLRSTRSSCSSIASVADLLRAAGRARRRDRRRSSASPAPELLSRTIVEERLGLERAARGPVLHLHEERADRRSRVARSSTAPRSPTSSRTPGGYTLKLGLAALVLTYVLAIPLGVLAAWKRNSIFDQGARLLAVLGMGIPNFFLAILLIQLFAVELRLARRWPAPDGSNTSSCPPSCSRWSRWRSTCG